MNPLYSCCTRGATRGVGAWLYSSFSELKLSAPSRWGISEGENKCFYQGTALLHEGEDGAAREITPFCALVARVSRSYRTYSLVTRSRHPPSRRFLSSLVSFVIPRTFPFASPCKDFQSGIYIRNFVQVLPPVCNILQGFGTAALQNQGSF